MLFPRLLGPSYPHHVAFAGIDRQLPDFWPSLQSVQVPLQRHTVHYAPDISEHFGVICEQLNDRLDSFRHVVDIQDK